MRLIPLILLLALPCFAATYTVTTSPDFETAKAAAVAGDTVLIRGGTYFRTNTLALVAANSGVLWKNYPGENPQIIGGLPVSNFVAYGSFYRADVSTQGFGGLHFHQLFKDGFRQNLARFPNYAGTGTNSYHLVATGGLADRFTYTAGDVHTYTNVTALEVFYYETNLWQVHLSKVTSIDTVGKIIYLTNPDEAINDRDRWYLQNALEELDAPGEWYLDYAQKWLYFYPSNSLSGSMVVAPVTTNLFTISGATNITIQGLTMWGYEGAAVKMSNATNCLVAANTIKAGGTYILCSLPQFNTGGDSGVMVLGGTGNGVEGNDISYQARWGVYVNGGDMRALVKANHYVDNNYIHDVGVFDKFMGGGIEMYTSDTVDACGVRISRNVFANLPRDAIRFYGNSHTIVSNYISNVMLETDDGGAMYGSGSHWWGGWGTVIANNYISMSHGPGYLGGYMNTFRGNCFYCAPQQNYGIYLDWVCNGTLIYSNVLSDCWGSGLYIHGGLGNTVTNNIIHRCQSTSDSSAYGGAIYYASGGTYGAFEADWQAATNANNAGWSAFPAWSLEPASATVLSSNLFSRNIVVTTNSFDHDLSELIKNVTVAATVVDYDNLYWTVIASPFGDGSTTYNWANWTNGSGFEVHGINTDPQVNYATWQVAAGSPAVTALGFRSFTTNYMGCYLDPLRASWPLGSVSAYVAPSPPPGLSIASKLLLH